MPHFRCQPISSQNQQCGLHRPAGLSGQAWARYLQAGSAANLHKLRRSLPKRVRQSQHSFVLFASAAPAQTASRRPKATANTDSELLDCVIVGAGISGLTLAQAFASEHSGTVAKVIITEAQDRVGGNITTKKADGFQYETGPNSFQPSDPVLKLAVSSKSSLHISCTVTVTDVCMHVLQVFCLVSEPYVSAQNQPDSPNLQNVISTSGGCWHCKRHSVRQPKSTALCFLGEEAASHTLWTRCPDL